MRTIELIHVTVLDRPEGYNRGRDAAGQVLRHARGHNVYALAEAELTADELAELRAVYPGSFRDARVPRAELPGLKRQPSPLVVVMGTAEVGKLDVRNSKIETTDPEGGTGDNGAAVKTDYTALTYNELKALAAQHGLDASGKKDELIARLAEWDAAQTPPAA